MSSVSIITTKHDRFRGYEFAPGSTVIDPWRYMPDGRDWKVRRIGENKPALISILVPTRGRPEMFKRMYDSICATVTYPRSVEVIAWLDEDDLSQWDYASIELGDVDGEFIVGERRLLSECWNECYKESNGEIVMHCGDDLTFNTKGWDKRVRDEFDKYSDRIALVFGDDLSTNFPDMATHGFLHRRWVETVGYFLPPLFSSDWNDVWISEVAQKLGRLVPIADVVIEHHHYTFGKAERDQTHAEREERGARDDVVSLFKQTASKRKADAAKLKKVMAA